VKDIEVRKTKPKLDVPFIGYIYETGGKCGSSPCSAMYRDWQHKIIGEFICDKIFSIDCDSVAPFDTVTGDYVGVQCCLSRNQFLDYTHGKRAYGIHITNLQIYNTPKTLSEFGLLRPPQSWCYV